MILRNLSKKQLQDAIGEEILQRLAVLAPVLVPDSGDPTELYRKENLLKVLSAFAPSTLLRDKSFMRLLLDACTVPELKKIAEETGVGLNAKDFEARREALVARGWTDHEYCVGFARGAGLPASFVPPREVAAPATEMLAPSPTPFKRLKDYQVSIYEGALRELEHPLARLVMQMPTGSGKTRTAMEVICDVLNADPGNGIVVWLAHSEELCEQAIACFREVWAHLGARQCAVHRVFAGAAALPGPEHDGPAFVVAGFQKMNSLRFRRAAEIKSLASRVSLLVVDEAHKVLAPTYLAAAKALIGTKTQVVGLTATPGRGADSDTENKALAEFFFNKIVQIVPPPRHSVLSYLRARKVLSRVRMERLVTTSTFALTPAHRSALERDLDYPPGFLALLGDDDVRNVEIVKRLKKLCDAEARVLFFACSVEHSRFVCALLVYLGISAVHVDGQTPAGERAAAISGFRSGNIRVLCNFGVLSTGFDAPKTDVVFVSRPTRSIVLYSQMIGRGLRGPAIGGTDECRVVNVVDNIVGLPDDDSIYDYFDDYWAEQAA